MAAPPSEPSGDFNRAMAAQSAGERVPPLFSAPPGTSEKMSINLDDIFADCFFTNEDVALLDQQTAPKKEVPTFKASGPSSKPTSPPSKAKPHIMGGGSAVPPSAAADPRGGGAPIARPRVLSSSSPPDAAAAAAADSFGADSASLGDDDDQQLDDDDDDDDAPGQGGPGGGGKKKPGGTSKSKRSRTSAREMTEQQKDERRERNREHAKRSRVRKKFLLESLQQSVNALQYENDKLRVAIREKMGDDVASELLANVGKELAGADQGDGAKAGNSGASLIAKSPGDATRILDDPDYSLVKALQTAQQNFVITDPSLPDNPIVFASQGFLSLTGYSLDNVLGRNCRFLQGPRTDPRAVAKIRKAVEEGYDTSVCLLNYRIDGSTFYNQFFVAPLRDGDGNVVNYVGVQCQVSDAFAQAIARDEQSLANA